MRRQTDVLRILILVFAGLIALLVIFGSIYLISASKKLKAIELSPDFVETELEVGTQYNFSINTTPSKASTKKLECVVDDPMCTFEVGKNGKATLTTGLAEGAVTVYVESKGIKSQVLTFNVVDSAARAVAEAEAAAAAAEAAAAQEEAAAAEAEAQASMTKYVKCIGDDVRVRAQNNTDCDILGKAMSGDVFEKVEDVDDWTHIIFKGGDGYMKTEYLQEISEEEAMTSLGDNDEDADGEEEENKKTDETKKNEENTNNTQETTASTTQTREEAEAKAAADAAAAAAAEAQAALEAAAAAQAAAAASGTVIHCKDGDCLVNASQLQTIHATWDFAGDAVEMAGHHSVSELEAVVGAVTRL